MKTPLKLSPLFIAILLISNLLQAESNLSLQTNIPQKWQSQETPFHIFLPIFTKNELKRPQPDYEKMLEETDEVKQDIEEYIKSRKALEQYLADYESEKEKSDSEMDDWNATLEKVRKLRMTIWGHLQKYYDSKVEKGFQEIDQAAEGMKKANVNLKKVVDALKDDPSHISVMELVTTIETIISNSKKLGGDDFALASNSTDVAEIDRQFEDLVFKVVDLMRENEIAIGILEKIYEVPSELENQILDSYFEMVNIQDEVIGFQIMAEEAEENSEPDDKQ